jgi:hypothetical protein
MRYIPPFGVNRPGTPANPSRLAAADATLRRSVSVRAAYAFGDWPPSGCDYTDRLGRCGGSHTRETHIRSIAPSPFTFAGGDWPQGLTADSPLVDLLLPPAAEFTVNDVDRAWREGYDLGREDQRRVKP